MGAAKMGAAEMGIAKMGFPKAFEPSEHAGRVEKVKRRMDDRGLDLLICQDPANMGWLTGFDGWSFYTPQAVLLHQEAPQPIWFGRKQDAKSGHITTDLPSENIVAYAESLVHHPSAHPFDALAKLILGKGWGRSRIGVELDAHYYTARAHRHLEKGLPNAEMLDSGELVNWARLVKSDAELVYMRQAGAIVTKTMTRALAKLRPGVPQYEIMADVYAAQILGTDGNYGDYTSLCPLIQVGEGTSTPHLTWTDEPLPANGPVVMELGAARRHYHAPLTRTAYLGPPPDGVRRLVDAILEGGDKALAAAKPGVTCAEVEAVWQATLKRHGFSKDSRVGYSIGMNYPPDWGERTASLRPGDETVLQSGMCFHFQSGVWLDDFGAAISEPFEVTAHGGKRLSNVERKLFVID